MHGARSDLHPSHHVDRRAARVTSTMQFTGRCDTRRQRQLSVVNGFACGTGSDFLFTVGVSDQYALLVSMCFQMPAVQWVGQLFLHRLAATLESVDGFEL